MDIEAGKHLALDSKAALGLATPNLPTVESKTTNIGEGIGSDPNGQDKIVFTQPSEPYLSGGWNWGVSGLRLAVGIGVGHPQKSNRGKCNNKYSRTRQAMVNGIENITILYLILIF